ncbi:Auxin-induced protein [Hordeum vulgare]|nr:Auxin-induced protein [Hordeum vulgare]
MVNGPKASSSIGSRQLHGDGEREASEHCLVLCAGSKFQGSGASTNGGQLHRNCPGFGLGRRRGWIRAAARRICSYRGGAGGYSSGRWGIRLGAAGMGRGYGMGGVAAREEFAGTGGVVLVARTCPI